MSYLILMVSSFVLIKMCLVCELFVTIDFFAQIREASKASVLMSLESSLFGEPAAALVASVRLLPFVGPQMDI